MSVMSTVIHLSSATGHEGLFKLTINRDSELFALGNRGAFNSVVVTQGNVNSKSIFEMSCY